VVAFDNWVQGDDFIDELSSVARTDEIHRRHVSELLDDASPERGRH
jgi:hypothetical protein